MTAREDPIPLSPARLAKLFKRGRLVLFLDGLDEFALHGGSARETLPQQLQFAISRRAVLTCQRVFFDLYLRDVTGLPNFDSVAILHGVDFATNGRAFIESYCRRFGLDTADDVAALITSSPALSDLVTRPLILFMATDLLAHQLAGVPNETQPPQLREWTVAKVYELYVQKWLNLEREKGTTLHWQDIAELCEAVAWRIFELAVNGRKAFGQFDVQDLTLNRANIAAVVGKSQAERRHIAFVELTTRSFLIQPDSGDYYRFAHKSFFEFFAARHLKTSLTKRYDDVDTLAECFDAPLPDEIIDVLRQMLAECSTVPTDCTAVRENMLALLDATAAVTRGANDNAVMLRQQVANLLPIMLKGDDEGVSRLRALHACEQHPFVRRGIAVGFALHLGDGSLIECLFDDLDRDPEALAFHLGYSRIYYGDQEPGANGWRDDGSPACERFFLATIRHFESSFYEFIWPMSIRSVRVLLGCDERRRYLHHKIDLPSHLALLTTFAAAQKPSEKPHERARRLTISRVIPT